MNSSNPCPVCGRPITHGIAGCCSFVCATSTAKSVTLHKPSGPDPVDDEITPLDILPTNFHEDALGAVGVLAKTMETNARRKAVGHPPVNCQLTAAQTEALSGMVMGLTVLLQLKGGKQA